jgi:hypothetical protein
MYGKRRVQQADNLIEVHIKKNTETIAQKLGKQGQYLTGIGRTSGESNQGRIKKPSCDRDTGSGLKPQFLF